MGQTLQDCDRIIENLTEGNKHLDNVLENLRECVKIVKGENIK